MKHLSRVLVFCILLLSSQLGASIVINEVLASNNSVNANSFGEYGDWVELFNSGDQAIDLQSYYLSDDADELGKWSFPSVTIAPGAFLLIWATDRDLLTPEGEIHTSFKISNQETISLSAPDLQIVDQVVLPVLSPNQSWGRELDGSPLWLFYNEPSPGLSNNSATGYLGFLNDVTPSHSSGFYPQEINLTFSNIPDGATLLYTLDGSEAIPGASSTQVYIPDQIIPLADRSQEANGSSEIRTTVLDGTSWIDTWYPPNGLVNKANVIRTKLIKPGYQDSQGLALTYFIGPQFNTAYSGIPVLSLLSNPDGMFGDYNGIYVPGLDPEGNPNTTTTANFRQDWEREATFQLWEPDRNQGFVSKAAMKIHGSASSRLNRKALRLNFKGSLGYQNLSYPLLNPNITEEYDAFLVRASGQDAHHLQFRDAIGQVIFLKQDIGSTHFRPSILFINGEYWGLHNLRERSDEDFIARYYAADVDVMDCLENRGVANPEERVGTRARYMELLNYAKNNDLNLEANFQTLASMMDMENYINYYIAQIFVANSDWPAYNVRMWRHKTEIANPGVYYQENQNNRYLDGRFRWILFDLDQSLGRFHNYNSNTLQTAGTVGTWNDNFFLLFRKLIGATNATGDPVTDSNGIYSNGSDQFRTRFINSFCDALNTYLLPERTTPLVTTTQSLYAPFMPEHIDRWGVPASISLWNTYANGVRSFLNNRPAAIRLQLQSKFQLQNGMASITLDVNNPAMGFIRLNSLNLGANEGFESLPYTGQYFQDVPIQISAIANPGYRFIGYSGIASASPFLSLNLEGDISIVAIFEESGDDFEGDSLNPEPHNLNLGPYSFMYFPSDSAPGAYPANMRFLMSANPDPNFDSEMTVPYTSPYNMTSRTRIEGLDGAGIAMVNTGNPAPSGSTTGYLGAIVLGLKSSGRTGLRLSFTIETMEVNSRIYGVALQYRIGTEGDFSDVYLDGVPLRYIRSTTDGDVFTYHGISLPSVLDNQPYFQLRWKYYYISGASGARPKIRLDDIFVYDNTYSLPLGVKINELMSSIDTWEHPNAADDFGVTSDWIELYNPTDAFKNLNGCYLSDNENHIGRWMLPDVSIAPHGFVLIRASNRDIQNSTQPHHTNFAISSAGEPIIFSGPDGTNLDLVAATPIPTDMSYARLPDGIGDWVLVNNPSPGMPNMILSAPADVQIWMGPDYFYLAWTQVPQATSYKIYSAEDPLAEVWELLDEIQDNSYYIPSSASSKRFFRIIAR